MASQAEAEAARRLRQGRLQAEGEPSYTNAPDRRAVGALRIRKETGHE